MNTFQESTARQMLKDGATTPEIRRATLLSHLQIRAVRNRLVREQLRSMPEWTRLSIIDDIHNTQKPFRQIAAENGVLVETAQKVK